MSEPEPRPPETLPAAEPQARDDAQTAPKRAKPPKRPLLVRLFGISLWGGVKLAGLCIVVGAAILAAQFNPRDPDTVGQTLANTFAAAWTAAGWAVRNLWKPALAGAAVVLPVWILWRLASLPFRR